MGVSSSTNLYYIAGKDNLVRTDPALTCYRWSKFSRPSKPVRYADLSTRELLHAPLLDTSVCEKKTVTLLTEHGYRIECSDDTEIYASDKWVCVKDVDIGLKISVNGTPDERYKDHDVMKRWYIDEGKSQAEIAEMTGASERTIRAWVKKHELNRGDAGALFGMDNPRYKGDAVSFKGGYMRTHAEYDSKLDLTTCSRCGATGVEMNIHHDDRNPTNISEDNLEVLCVMCHKMEHLGPVVRHMSYDHIKNILYGGHQKVYDFKTCGDNYVANGFIIRGIQ